MFVERQYRPEPGSGQPVQTPREAASDSQTQATRKSWKGLQPRPIATRGDHVSCHNEIMHLA